MLVRKRGLEPLRPCEHYPLKVACIPISPLPQKVNAKNTLMVKKNQYKFTFTLRFFNFFDFTEEISDLFLFI